MISHNACKSKRLTSKGSKWDKVFKNGPSKICGRPALKSFEGI